MNKTTAKKNAYLLTAILSFSFALIGFSYNVWRLEVTEENNTIRTAGFQVLIELSELEQIIYAAHFDNNLDDGSPRKGWVKVGLINDLSPLISPAMSSNAEQLKSVWQENWSEVKENRQAVDEMVNAIDSYRLKLNSELKSLN